MVKFGILIDIKRDDDVQHGTQQSLTVFKAWPVIVDIVATSD